MSLIDKLKSFLRFDEERAFNRWSLLYTNQFPFSVFHTGLKDESSRRKKVDEALVLLADTLTSGINSVENYLALMTEGEGDNAKVYQDMAGSCGLKLKPVLAKLREHLEGR